MAHRPVLKTAAAAGVHARRFVRVGVTVSIAVVAALVAPWADADSRRASITFYRANKLGQLYEVRIVRHTDEPGCHNFPRKTDVYRVGQVGFDHCEVYTEKLCADGSAVTATWNAKVRNDESKKYPTTRLTQGNMWVLSTGGNVTLRSWRCAEAETTPD